MRDALTLFLLSYGHREAVRLGADPLLLTYGRALLLSRALHLPPERPAGDVSTESRSIGLAHLPALSPIHAASQTTPKPTTENHSATVTVSRRASPRAFARLPSSVIRHRLSIADEQGLQHQSKAIAPSKQQYSIVSSAISAARPTSRRISFQKPSDYNVDDLLSRCPSLDAMAAIRRDFNISFDARLDDPWSCQTDGAESSTMLTVYNAFRAMRLIDFDTPIPVLNATNLYEWLFSLNLTNIHFTVGEQWSFAERGAINLRGEVLDAPEMRVWIDPRSGVGLMDVVLLIVHEARHARALGNPNADADDTIGHPCSNDPSIEHVHDPSIEYGGAWAAQYWTSRWLAEHSGHYLSSLEKRYASGAAEQVRISRFCNGGTR